MLLDGVCSKCISSFIFGDRAKLMFPLYTNMQNFHYSTYIKFDFIEFSLINKVLRIFFYMIFIQIEKYKSHSNQKIEFQKVQIISLQNAVCVRFRLGNLGGDTF